MERLPNESLDNAISVYKTTIEAVEKHGDTEYDPALDEVTVELLEELKEYHLLPLLRYLCHHPNLRPSTHSPCNCQWSISTTARLLMYPLHSHYS